MSKIITIGNTGYFSVPNSNSWGVSTIVAKPYTGSKRSSTFTINGIECETYNYFYPGPPYIQIPTNAALYYAKNGYFYKTSSTLKFRPNGFGDNFSKYFTPNYVIKFWVVYNNYWYLLFEEVNKKVVFYNNHNYTYSPHSVKPYQLFDFHISGTATQHTIEFNSGNIINDVTTYVSYNSLSEVDELFELEGQSIYDTNNQMNLPFMISIKRPSVWMFGDFSIIIDTTDWDNKEYSLKENATDYSVYVGKEIGDDFLNHFSLIYTQSNEYKSITTVVQSSLSKESLSKTKFSCTDYVVAFNYTYNNSTMRFSSSKKIIPLANELVRFNLLSIKNDYKQGEYFESSKIDIKNSGSLLYEDGTAISLSKIDWVEEPSIDSSIGDSSYLDEGCLGFEITYIMPTVHFGTLNYTFHADVSGQTEDYITNVELINTNVDFKTNSLISVSETANLVCYNFNNEVIKTINFEDFNKYISEYPKNYGSIVPEHFYIDSPITLNFKFQNYREFDLTIYVSYYEKKLDLDISKAKREYYIGGKYSDNLLLDSSNIKAFAIYHSNKKTNLGVITRHDVSESVTLECIENIDVFSGTKIYPVTVQYKDLNTKQSVINTFDISVTKYEATNIEIIGYNDTLHYWDNNVDVFHYPNGLTFNRIFSDGTIEEITDLSVIQFYRDANLTNRLVIGSSIIKENDGSRIYVYDPVTKISGYFIIEFDVDTILNAYLLKNINFTLGNRFNSIRSEIEIEALYASGVTGEVNNYSFKNNDYILEETDLIIIIDEKEYVLNGSKITFIKPNICNILVNTSKFPLTYNNLSDSIDASTLILTVQYENAEYTETCYFKNGETIENNTDFLITCAEMPTYTFDGTKDLDITMGEYFEKILPLNVKVRNRFDFVNEINTNTTLNISVLEITEITGISLVKIFTDYYVNDTFLNDNDSTEVQIFYKDSNGIQKKLQIKLNSDFSALNIFPLKGTKFTNVTNSRTIKITSATNYNVCCEYTISVNSKYNYSSTKTHDIVAIYQGAYTAPNGTTITDKYILIDRMDDEGFNNTKINPNGERILVENKIISDVKVYGYLDDVFDETKNARVILFDDYIAPVEGTNNITVKFPCYVKGNADIINKCRFGILFGNNNAKNRLFVSGNKDVPNCDWHSGQIDSNYLEDESMINGNFGYFEDTSYCYYGETDNAIVGYDIVSNDKLLVLKNKSDKETTVYFRTPTLLQAFDATGTAMSGIDGETLYQEEFTMIKGNNSIAAISSKGIVNFNGDSLFLSDDKSLVGLDLIGIIGDNQRYANSRSRYIDEDLKKYDMTKSWLWSNNKDLYLVLDDKIFFTNYETRVDNQYEWWVMNLKDIQSVIEISNQRYLANSKGQLYKATNKYDDIDKIFIGQGGSLLITEGTNTDQIIVSELVMNQFVNNAKYLFKVVPAGNEDVSYMYFQIASVSNVKNGTFDFYVNNKNNCLELMCYENGTTNYENMNKITNLIGEEKYVFLNHLDGESEIGAFPNSTLKKYYRKYYLKRYFIDEDITLNDCYKLIDAITNEEVDISELYRCNICYRLDEEYEIAHVNKALCSFKIKHNGNVVNLVRYAEQDISRSFRAEIKQYKPVEAYYITKPFTMGSLDYFKTIWSWTLTNDTSIPSELEIAIANNKIPFDSMRTLAGISKDKFGFDLNNFDFHKIDLQKNLVPRTYTNQRIISQLKFICFGFRNFNNTNSVLSSMSMIYTIPFPSYGGD